MASKRRNMLYENKKQETTENGGEVLLPSLSVSSPVCCGKVLATIDLIISNYRDNDEILWYLCHLFGWWSNTIFRRATLLICGCVLAGGFCSNVVYRLEGEATDLTVKESFKVSMPIYAATFLTLHILAPYKEQATYELWYSETEPTHGKLEELSQWRKVRQLKVPRQLFLGCDELVVPGTDSIRLTPLQQEFEKKEAKRLKTQEKEGGMAEDECVTRLASESAQEFCLGRTPRRSMHQLRDQEPGVLPLYAACYRLRPSSFWLIFSNKKVGDFIIKITLMGRDCPTALTISVPVLTPGGAESPPPEGGPVTSGATCGRIEDKGATPDGKLSVASEPEWETSLVPLQKVARVFLPWRNSRLWTTVRAMFFLTLEEKEKPFWTNHLETRIGLKLVKWMLGSRSGRISEEINQIFKKEVTYTLTSSSPLAQFNSRLTIPDILDNSYVELLVNISEEATSNFSTILTLVAEDKEEMRKYEIKFNFPHRKCSSK
ncbi:hypothetical protein AAG570_001990 [Ranatra chinensis]|uniref:Uncharacterized protein n=1 Tax=Ranatra chinensis TaxID=642074 RepID=A0ABD0YA55_9HEMI